MTWNQQHSKTAADLIDTRFLNRTSGWAVGDKGTIVRTDDSGSNWVVQNGGKDDDPSLRPIDFATPSSGWAVGDHRTILHTADAGRGWQSQSSATSSGIHNLDMFTSVKLVTPTSGWVVGMVGTVLHTEDGGNHWQEQDVGTKEVLYAITFAPTGKTSP